MPKPVQLSTPELRVNGDEALIKTNLSGVEPSGEIRFRLPVAYAPDQQAMNDAMFPIGFMIAMATGRRLELRFPVSQRLVDSSQLANEIYVRWFPSKLSPITIDVSTRQDKPVFPLGKSKAISAFTGGVDSFATALRKREHIGAHFYVFGYDLPLDTEFKSLRNNVRINLRRATERMQKRIAFVTTNVRTYINPHTNWASMSHGPAISAVAHLLSPTYDTLYIPASFTYNNLQPWGSHPLTDPLWSSDRLSVFHDGAHLSRVEKTIQVASEPAVQNHLRVCLSKRTEYNCGNCVKCLRTMLGLELAGGLKDSRVFPNVLDLKSIRDIHLSTPSQVIFMDELIHYSLEYGREDIAEALRVSVDRYHK